MDMLRVNDGTLGLNPHKLAVLLLLLDGGDLPLHTDRHGLVRRPDPEPFSMDLFFSPREDVKGKGAQAIVLAVLIVVMNNSLYFDAGFMVGLGVVNGQLDDLGFIDLGSGLFPVSYTHLTLPTIYSV